ncbi:integrase [Daphnia sinensis]|uniref:Integrase n=1 Tax=Daphnia sinensis TaxID=1820382 RepID=A0AAD5L1T2_9CRUS|nr:integrase [Daphnia sinensis]
MLVPINATRPKLDTKAVHCTVGYSDKSKAYRDWNPATRAIVISRDVVFDEDSAYSGKGQRPRDRTKQHMFMSQSHFIIDLLQKYNMSQHTHKVRFTTAPCSPDRGCWHFRTRIHTNKHYAVHAM